MPNSYGVHASQCRPGGLLRQLMEANDKDATTRPLSGRPDRLGPAHHSLSGSTNTSGQQGFLCHRQRCGGRGPNYEWSSTRPANTKITNT
eukprot:2898814-Karenia_brevis.AAC.1